VADHQLKEINGVKHETNSVVIDANVNRMSKNFRDLESDEVLIKIFISSGHKKPITNFQLYACSLIERSKKNAIGSNYYKCEPLIVLKLEDIVIMKKIINAKNILEMLKENPRHSRKYLKEILKTIKVLSFWDWRFWRDEISIDRILWSNNRWVIINRTNRNTPCNEDTYIASNFLILFETFLKCGMKAEEAKKELLSFITGKNENLQLYGLKNYSHMTNQLKERFKIDEIFKSLGWVDFKC
jgi:hypothetical protein